MEIKTLRPKPTPDRPAGWQIQISLEAETLRSKIFHSEDHMRWQLRNRPPGIQLFTTGDEVHLAGHLHLTPEGEYQLRKYSPPKSHISYAGHKLEFHKEVKTVGQAQRLLDGFRHAGIPAACLHRCGLHQVYAKH